MDDFLNVTYKRVAGGGEGCIGVLQVGDVNKQMVGERSNILYMFGVCFAFFALSAKE